MDWQLGVWSQNWEGVSCVRGVKISLVSSWLGWARKMTYQINYAWSILVVYFQWNSHTLPHVSKYYFKIDTIFCTFAYDLSAVRVISYLMESRAFWNQYSNYYPNVTTLRSGLCYRNSVCRLSVCLSVVCRLSVCNVGAPYSGGWTFRQNFFTAVYAGHHLTSVQNFTEIVLGEPLHRSVKRKRGIKIERFWTYRRLYLINGTR